MDDFVDSSSPLSECRESIQSVFVLEGVESIGANAFGDLSELEKVRIPSSARSIGMNPFVNCPHLSLIDVHCENPEYTSEDSSCSAVTR